MKLAVFDFDSTLMDGETIDFLAEELGIGEKKLQKLQKKQWVEDYFFWIFNYKSCSFKRYGL